MQITTKHLIITLIAAIVPEMLFNLVDYYDFDSPKFPVELIINFGNMFIVTNSDGVTEGISFFPDGDYGIMTDNLVFEVRDSDGKLDSMKRGLKL